MGWFRRTHDRATWQAGDILAPATSSGVRVTPDTALRLSALWGCVRLLADVVSELPVHVFTKGTRDEVDPPRVLVTPAAGVDLPEWLWMHMHSWCLRGNAVGVIVDRARLGRPSQIELINPDRVTAQVDQTTRTVVWRLDGAEVDYSDLWHRRAYPVPGQPLGLSPVAHFAQSIGLGLAAEAYGATWFRDAHHPSGLLSTEQRIDPRQAADLRERWNRSRQGRRDVAVLGDGLKFSAVTVAPEESQFLDAMRFNIAQVARMFGIAPEMLGAESGDSMTYSNLENRDLSLLKYAVSPWLGRLERAMNTLVSRNEYVKFNAAALVRTDLKTRYEAHEIGLRAGFLTIDEVRDLEDRQPLPAGAQQPEPLRGVA